MKQIIYVAQARNQKSNVFLSYNLEPLLPILKQKYSCTNAKRVLNCYAFLENAKNTFIWRAPFDIDVKYTGDERLFIIDNISLNSQEDFNSCVLGETPELLQLFTGFGMSLYTETPTVMSVSKAVHHNTKDFYFPIVEASYDISNWFRQIHPAIINLEKKDFSIKRGDPLFYVKFHTKNNTVLKYVYMTEELQRISSTSNKLQLFKPKNPLSFLYGAFNRSKVKRVIMNEIEKQL